MLKFQSVLVFLFFIFGSTLPVMAECNQDSPPMQKGIIYSFADVEIVSGFIGKNQSYLTGKFTTSRLKPNEVKTPFYEEGEYTIVHRTCAKKIQVVEKTKDYIRVICPR
jgi:hypothetical protein